VEVCQHASDPYGNILPKARAAAYGAAATGTDMNSGDFPIIVKAAGKRYGAHEVLRAIDLTVAAGEFVVVVGRSGSGKSTLLNLLGGLDQASSGEVLVLGEALSTLSDQALSQLRRSTIGFVFQAFNLIPTLTVAENIALPLALNRSPRAAAAQRLDEVLNELGIAELKQRFPDELSGGEQQRVAIGRAIVHKPRIVLADEPTGNLDLETAQTVVTALDTACRRYGATLVMATHASEVIGRADRIVVIRNAELETVPP
jgi:putative ABC transport system ATP-binding protein